jgi:hypothetical protein
MLAILIADTQHGITAQRVSSQTRSLIVPGCRAAGDAITRSTAEWHIVVDARLAKSEPMAG